MADRELLEKAAKAAGYDVIFGSLSIAFHASGIRRTRRWDPRFYDGDAMRLVVDCHLSVQVWAGAPKYPDGVTIVTTPDDEEFIEPHGFDKFTATRLAITRAAAAIGEGKSHG